MTDPLAHPSAIRICTQIDSGLITPATVIDDTSYMNEKKPTERYPTNYSQNRYPGLTIKDAVEADPATLLQQDSLFKI